MDNIVNQLMGAVRRSFAENLRLSDELLLAAHCLFQAPLQSALDLVDRKNVTRLVSPSGRSVFQVIGSSGIPYVCCLGVNYCECLAYQFSVLQKSEYLMCKHVLAVLFSEAMTNYKQQQVSDEKISNLLNHTD